MTDLNRIRKLAGVPLMEAEQTVWTPDAAELEREEEARMAALDAESDARYDVEAKIEKNIMFALGKVGIELKDNRSIYFDDEETIEMMVEYDYNGLPLERLNALAQSGIGSSFQIQPSGDFLQIRFKVDPNLATATAAE